MARPTINIKEIKKRIFLLHGNTIVVDEDFYIDTKTKCRFIDKDYGEFFDMPYNILRNSKHPKRNNIKKILRELGKAMILPIEEVKKRLFSIHGDKVVLDEDTYEGTRIKAHFIDREFGEWWATPAVVLKGSRHPKSGDSARRKNIEKALDACRLSIEEVKKRIFEQHGDLISIDESTYINVHEKARFFDKEYGYWFASPWGILQGNRHPHGRARRGAKSQQRCVIKYHWKTNEILYCVASYEIVVVDYLNKNKIDYVWQKRTFKLPDGKHCYTPDLYLVKEDQYVEIKGYFREASLKKWMWFHSTYPNSELWDKKVLVEKGILDLTRLQRFYQTKSLADLLGV